MNTRNIIKINDKINLVQIFDTDEDGAYVAEYLEMEFHEPSSGTVHTVAFSNMGVSSEDLRTAADKLDANRFNYHKKSNMNS